MKIMFLFMFVALLLVLLYVVLMTRSVRHRTGGYRPELGPYARHGGGQFHPGVLY